MSTHGQGSQDPWPAPGQSAFSFVVMIAGGYPCHTCRVMITPGATGYRCGDGQVRCAEHKSEGTS
jgi:hypothetical protein